MTYDLTRKIDPLKYLMRRNIPVRPRSSGVYTFNCPFCHDTRRRGWVIPESKNFSAIVVGCWNSGCIAHPKLRGGFVEFVRILGNFQTKGEAFAYLLSNFGISHRAKISMPKPVSETFEFLSLPESIPASRSNEASSFAAVKWGLFPETLDKYEIRFIERAKTIAESYRLVFPIRMNGDLVGYQTRAINPQQQPRYITKTEINPVLYLIDLVNPGDNVVLVEGVGDALRFNQGCSDSKTKAVALLGSSINASQIALISIREPGSVTLALDSTEPLSKTVKYCKDLRSWGLSTYIGKWVGAKDAGDGATLSLIQFTTSNAVRALLNNFD